MRCPDCQESLLESVLSRQGIEVDYCRKCRGVWLERGEIYLLACRHEIASRRLKEAEVLSKAVKLSPKTNTRMTPINYPEGKEIYICDSGGIWIEGLHVGGCKDCNDNDDLIPDLGILCVPHNLQAAARFGSGSIMEGNMGKTSRPNSWKNIADNLTLMFILSIGAILTCLAVKHIM